MDSQSKNPQNLRVIRTARSLDDINSAVKEGYYPLILRVTNSHSIKEEFTVLQHKTTGAIEVFHDGHDLVWFEDSESYETIIDWSTHYQYSFPCPYAAYLIPKGLGIGERVFLEDLIEDYIGTVFNSNIYRLASCEAIWDGETFDVLYDPEIHTSMMRS